MLSWLKLTSFENSSIIRKFTIFYFLASIVPLGVLDYLYIELHSKGRLEITEDSLMYTLIFVALGVVLGYFTMRSILLRVVNLAQQNVSTVAGIIGPERMRAIDEGTANEISILTQSFQEITSRLEENVRNLELAKRTLHSVMARVGDGMASLDNIDSFLNLIVETVSDALQTKSGVLMLFDERDQGLYVKAVHGRKFDARKRMRFDSREEFFTRVVESRQAKVCYSVPANGNFDAFFEPPVLCAPLLLHDKFLGIIAVSGRITSRDFDQEEMNILNNLVLQTAVAIENSRLNDDAEKTYFETISALAMAVEAKDPYSRGHSDRVANYAVQIAQYMGLGQEDIQTLRDAAKMHDLGKIGVVDSILRKESPLTSEEMEMMKKHCEIGEGIIKPIRSLRHLCDPIRHHHEKIDGSGYPDGLKGAQVTPLVRILAVSDIFDALTTSRPYRQPFTAVKAMAELRGMKNQIDQNVVDALEKSLV